ncbi:hypothetical protein SAMN05216420_11079 [Nitrosospira sp. Nl5]|uniref:hypothetical protein n=1 Tax=Nitrosospira sp. Nl5 TaxID=200120 RepID=UPI000890B28C|nr:hypothetical protein [Nitrosospira sp. Nl5]SCY62264.1 hypothetical protein SAMN05216420_11079 [Nitrosospira sp. Nl5]
MKMSIRQAFAVIAILFMQSHHSNAIGSEIPQELDEIAFRFKIGPYQYTLGRYSGGAQYGVFALCRGPGRVPEWALDDDEQKNMKASNPRRKLEWPENDCFGRLYHGEGGAWLNSPDQRYFYLQDVRYMDHETFYLIDVTRLTSFDNLKTPASGGNAGGSGPSPATGEVAFNNSSSLLAVLSEAKELWIYDRVQDTKWVFRTSIPGFYQLAAIQPLDSQRILLWSDNGEVSLLNIDKREKKRIGTVPGFRNDPNSFDLRFVIVSPNLKYATFVSKKGVWVLHVPSGKVSASVSATEKWVPDVSCVDQYGVEKVGTVLPRSAGRCGRTIIKDNGNTTIAGADGSLRELKAAGSVN